MATDNSKYPVKFDVKYPGNVDQVSSFFRILWSLPIVVLLSILTSPSITFTRGHESAVASSGGGIAGGLFVATALMIVFRQRYPRWWFDFARDGYFACSC